MVYSHAAGLGIATWFLVSAFGIMIVSGQIVKYWILRRYRLDDYFLLLGTVLALGLSAAYSIAASHGFGNVFQTDEQLVITQKALYSADILYVAAICSVKLSLLAFLQGVMVEDRQRRSIKILGTIIGLIATASMLALAFSCSLPQAWQIFGTKCFDQFAYWVAFTVLDVVTDIFIVAMAATMVWKVQFRFTHKAIVVFCFAPRLIVAAVAVTRLAYLSRAFLDGPLAFKLWVAVLCTELQLCLSISSACIPSIKPLFEVVESGVWQADDLRRRGLSFEDLHRKGYLKATFVQVELSDHSEATSPDAISPVT